MAKKTPELVAEALRLRKQGMTLGAIGKQLGVSQPTIGRWTNPEAAEKQRERSRKSHEVNRGKHRERCRKYREANREKELERKRRYREANREKVREGNRESRRKCSEANTLKHAKGKPLRSNYLKAQRPRILTRLLLQVAKDICLEWDFPVEQMFDAVVLRCAASTVRESPFLNGERNPWYCTDYLHRSTVEHKAWPYNLAKTWRNRV